MWVWNTSSSQFVKFYQPSTKRHWFLQQNDGITVNQIISNYNITLLPMKTWWFAVWIRISIQYIFKAYPIHCLQCRENPPDVLVSWNKILVHYTKHQLNFVNEIFSAPRKTKRRRFSPIRHEVPLKK